MALTHYPKLEYNIVMAWVWPRPPDREAFKASMPRFDEINLAKEPLAPGESFVGWHSAQGFTRFYSSVASDQPLEVTFEFSNDEVAPDGSWVTDANMRDLHYDVLERKVEYAPGDRKGHWTLILGRWLRVRVKNVGKTPTETLRIYVRGSVF